MTTYGEALAAGRAALSAAGVASAATDARLLLAAASKLDMAALIARGREELPAVVGAEFDAHIKRRLGGEPVARILGVKEFWGLPIAVGPAVLVPRPETETLVETVLVEIKRRFPSDVTIADLGTGSGAILIALLSELPGARGVATDVSEEALALARANAERNGVGRRIAFECVSFDEGPRGPFDVVVANPPYIKSEAIAGLEREVRGHDPHAALDGGPDGLTYYRAILQRVDSLLADGGLIGFEVDADQGEAVTALCRAAGLNEVSVLPDLAGRDRVVTAVATMSAVELEERKNRLEKFGGRASFPMQTRVKPQGWASISGRQTQRSPKAGSLASPSQKTS
ncbi:MAG: peptide chain release factor N(5)-glutamine methyltransferase [Propylenella sp.]